MQEETRILELLAEVLRQQDQTQAKLLRISEEMRDVKQDVANVKQDVREVRQDVQEVKATQAVLLENQQGHQQALRILATNKQKSQRELENIVDILDSVARMQRDMSRRLDQLENPGDFVR